MVIAAPFNCGSLVQGVPHVKLAHSIPVTNTHDAEKQSDIHRLNGIYIMFISKVERYRRLLTSDVPNITIMENHITTWKNKFRMDCLIIGKIRNINQETGYYAVNRAYLPWTALYGIFLYYNTYFILNIFLYIFS